jgi:uncharacterized membrane protein
MVDLWGFILHLVIAISAAYILTEMFHDPMA